MRFDGRVAVVTGAGGNPGLGRSQALLLASRGAKVVVNDLGVGPDGSGVLQARADQVAEEIAAAGGEAIAETSSVAEEDSAKRIVQAALDRWGRVDIMINNAGVDFPAAFGRTSSDDLRRVVDVHFYGCIWMCRAVWPHMEAAGYGRIVNITSNAMLGLRYQAVYGAAKAGVFGLTMGLAIEGAAKDIKVNCVGPRAATRGGALFKTDEQRQEREGRLLPEHVSPAVVFLAHEDCSVSGRYWEVHGGRVRDRFMSQTRGLTNTALTVEDVRDNLASVLDASTAIPLPIEDRIAMDSRFSEEALARYSAQSLERV
jgi:NAD(P)-dependent dehydrogenase (short-subunit alcohol dehydrogenase family)